ncbi:uncharacterized protein MICPUCDRAFT_46336 [Micromonas pusilla CCMP1545]|uniref:Predicted protein n=1 Tax=Micromonas pusilla (strain CCMP1545) TaxID=564608 RepID=C1MIG3_MICPC|nr:uncharacterized protein MICPUCDRAFT_46336 [Micromonas pusilla CCMP1545]EEH60377.1 predicted protein [Micromonas pusilla CCMP1545]|eukprot:XP_003055125.1 predicted protein [Micromonas pusilla CCMP1545]
MAFALSKTASLVATPKASSKIARRGAVVVRAEKVAHGKGGEEGGRSFANDAFGMVAKNANYGLFAAAVTKGGHEGTMTSPGPITVFCPNDDAFGDLCQKIGVSKMDLMNDPRIPAIVGTHIVQGALTLADMEGKTLTTMAGNSITVSGGAVNGVSFKKNDIKVDNGIVHAVNAVISP